MIIMTKILLKIARIEQGNLQTFVKETQYNLLADTLAKELMMNQVIIMLNLLESMLKSL